MFEMRSRLAPVVALALAGAAMVPAAASAHAEVSPKVVVAKDLQFFTLAVPTEKDNLTTNKIVMTVPDGFGIDSFQPPPAGWTQNVQQSGTGNSAVITKVTWSGGKVPTGQDSVFGFLADPATSKTYRFQIQQTYSDGSIVNWAGPEKSDAPASAVQAVDSLGGGGSSTLGVIALIVALVALAAAGLALAGRRGDGGGGAGGRSLT